MCGDLIEMCFPQRCCTSSIGIILWAENLKTVLSRRLLLPLCSTGSVQHIPDSSLAFTLPADPVCRSSSEQWSWDTVHTPWHICLNILSLSVFLSDEIGFLQALELQALSLSLCLPLSFSKINYNQIKVVSDQIASNPWSHCDKNLIGGTPCYNLLCSACLLFLVGTDII